ncbi:bifunctional folylpolyglutamate synthase/dihydrofolate synthase [Pelodictyon phaeoclathratiforme]|uniref:Dihydrofolate synthase/folylpolyglutamate synthase n=1 Tax=Pelodictyon phaeoclathratiforme (strain DSM 5477 / BU-1) TaxID=324925 RepID=B4SCR8_PELPB|nr:folylpolyglutamate synthase/dihydrofolate synthase family protein [Pelodictyon phaeoclathratiforme]ACF42752.1 FolC bifunctional protein [Pelodictyon phaeoclathratiforme BU-1]MBV5289724.1 bifunctional folylpolyglutamate synthase/dihydrofolate synthase [Pelodictyon phaeoclathratiforme]
MTYQEALDFLYPLHRFGIKPGLERVRTLLDLHGSPQKRLGLLVHIAGTNGKGSVAAALASIFQAAGKKCALYTSPHLVDFTERIRINGSRIPQERVAHYCTRFRDAVVENHSTFFEATTAIAFAWFADEGVDVTILETGMGGRLDATNVVHSDYVVITTIALDHTDWLGGTLPLIAAEKAAIIKKGSRVFTAVSRQEALLPIQTMAELCDAPLFVYGKDALSTIISAQPGVLELEVTTASRKYRGLKVPLTGSFHAANVSLAVMVAEDTGIAAEQISSGLERLLQTGYRARLEQIGMNPAILLDVSHNPDGMRETVNTLLSFRKKYRRISVVLGLASDKDARAVIRELHRLECSFVLVNIPSERSVSAEVLSSICQEEGSAATVCATGREGLAYLLSRAGADDLILVTGSFYLAGEIIATGR